MTPEDNRPLFSRLQLEYLQRVFPDKIPRKDRSDDTIAHLQGQMRVIDHIEAIVSEQESPDYVPTQT